MLPAMLPARILSERPVAGVTPSDDTGFEDTGFEDTGFEDRFVGLCVGVFVGVFDNPFDSPCGCTVNSDCTDASALSNDPDAISLAASAGATFWLAVL
ncbi:MAG: hypothetical protein ACR2RL_24180 [Gammaproteobacteria bacterium]